MYYIVYDIAYDIRYDIEYDITHDIGNDISIQHAWPWPPAAPYAYAPGWQHLICWLG